MPGAGAAPRPGRSSARAFSTEFRSQAGDAMTRVAARFAAIATPTRPDAIAWAWFAARGWSRRKERRNSILGGPAAGGLAFQF